MKIHTCLAHVVIILSNNLFQAVSPITLKCTKENSKKCIIPTYIADSKTNQLHLPDLSNKTGLVIKQGNLSIFSENLSRQLKSVEKLELGQLGLKEMFVIPELVELSARGNQIEIVRFKSSETEYRLTLLDLSRNRLTKLDGFETLSELRTLNLQDNALETVDFKIFGAMKNLEQLFLGRNKLTRVYASNQIVLPSLDMLSLAGNRLSNLDVTNWQLESLTDFNISSNEMVYIDGLAVQFISLHTISMENNWWHCSWLEGALKHLNENGVVLKGHDSNCQGKQIKQNICCITVEHINENYELGELNSLKQAQSDLQAWVTDDLKNLQKQLENQIESLNGSLNNLRLQASKLFAQTERDELPKRDFVELKKQVQLLKQNLTEGYEVRKKANSQHNRSYQGLKQTLENLNRSMMQESQKISEGEDQLKYLKSYVNSKLEKRN